MKRVVRRLSLIRKIKEQIHSKKKKKQSTQLNICTFRNRYLSGQFLHRMKLLCTMNIQSDCLTNRIKDD